MIYLLSFSDCKHSAKNIKPGAKLSNKVKVYFD